jgi:hypothetical protein
MNNKNEMPTSSVGVVYFQGILDSNDLLAIKDDLKGNGFLLVSCEIPSGFLAASESLYPHIQVFLSPDIVQTICVGIATNVIYDGIKFFLCSLRRLVKTKSFRKMQSGNVITDVTPAIHFNIGKMHAVLPMDIDDEKFKYFVDKALETVNEQIITKETYFIYSEKTEETRHYTQYEFIQNISGKVTEDN